MHRQGFVECLYFYDGRRGQTALVVNRQIVGDRDVPGAVRTGEGFSERPWYKSAVQGRAHGPDAALQLAALGPADLHRRDPDLRAGGAGRRARPRRQRRQLDQDLTAGRLGRGVRRPHPPLRRGSARPAGAAGVERPAAGGRSAVGRRGQARAAHAEGGGPHDADRRPRRALPRRRGGAPRRPPGHDPAADAGGGRAVVAGRVGLPGGEPPVDAELVGPAPCRGAEGGRGTRRRPRLPAGGPSRRHPEPPRRVPKPRPEPKPGRAAGAGSRRRRRRPPAKPAPAPAGGDVRVDAAALDAVAERATQVRIMALAGRQVVDRIYDLARLAEDGLHEPQPTQVLAVLATMLRRVAVELEGGQRRLIRSAEEQLEKMLSLQLQPLRGFAPLASPATPASSPARCSARSRSSWKARRPGSTAASPASSTRRCSTWCATRSTTASSRPRCARRAASRGPAASASRRLGGRPAGAPDDRGRRRRHRRPARVLQQAVEVGLIDAATAAGMGKKEALRLLFAPGFSTRKHGLRDLRPRRRPGRGGDRRQPGRRRGLPRVRARPGHHASSLEVPVARRGESVHAAAGGPAPASPCPPRWCAGPPAWIPGRVVERDGRTLVRSPWATGWSPSCRSPGSTASRRRQPAPARGGGLRPAARGLAVDDGRGGARRSWCGRSPAGPPTDRLLEGVALLASGEPVGVLSPSVLSQREYLRALPAARQQAVIRRVRVLLVDDSLVTREMERRLLEDAGFLVSRRGRRRGGPVAARRGELRLRGHRHRDAAHGRLRAGRPPARHGALRPASRSSSSPTRDRPEDRLRGLKVGADAYLTKQSLDAGELVDLVRAGG